MRVSFRCVYVFGDIVAAGLLRWILFDGYLCGLMLRSSVMVYSHRCDIPNSLVLFILFSRFFVEVLFGCTTSYRIMDNVIFAEFLGAVSEQSAFMSRFSLGFYHFGIVFKPSIVSCKLKRKALLLAVRHLIPVLFKPLID